MLKLTESNSKYWLASVLCLLTGALIYGLERPSVLGFNSLEALSLGNSSNYLPDMLWAMGFSYALLPLCSTSIIAYIWPLFTVCLIEFLQWADYWPGTGDWLDIAFSFLGILFVKLSVGYL